MTELDYAGVDLLGDDALRRVRHHMARIAAHSLHGTPVGAVLDEALDMTGKMLRPRLLLLCGAFGPRREERHERLCTLAAMVELTHLASLIHDDIIDEAEHRRGKPSIQSRFGKDAAVYAGDFLMARIKYFEAVEHLNDASAVLATAIEHMCMGEIGQAMCRFRPDTTISQYLSNIRGKTVALFQAACRIGAMESGCGEDMTGTLESFGENLGVMFQLRDDLLDFTADEHEMGKVTHKDFSDGIYTLPVLHALRHPDGMRQLLPIMEKNRKGRLSRQELCQAERIIVSLGGVEATRQEIRARQQKLEDLLAEFPPCQASYLLDKLVSKLAI